MMLGCDLSKSSKTSKQTQLISFKSNTVILDTLFLLLMFISHLPGSVLH